MSQLLLELFQEEIPARMQAQAAFDLRRKFVDALIDRGLTPLWNPELPPGTVARDYVTPRRLTLVLDLPSASDDVTEELKGPRTSAPPAALDGFLKKTGLTKDTLTIQADPKGDFYLAKISKPGRPAPAIIAEAAVETIRAFPWPKSMRWEPSRLQWVRPLRHILCLFDGQVVPFQIAGLTASNVTRGHRQMANEPFEVLDFDDYQSKLRERRVILDREDRKAEIHRQALAAAAKAGLNFREDPELLDEVAGLVEWPVVLTGKFDEAFLDVPNEVLVTTMRKNQKYFALTTAATGDCHPGRSEAESRDPGAATTVGEAPGSRVSHASGGLARDDNDGGGEPTPPRHGEVRAQRASNHAQTLSSHFLIVSNLEARDGGAAITAGNEKVIRPRLADAKFFWDLDRKTTLESRLEELKKITFHAKLGTQWDRVQRIERLAGEIAERIGCNEQQIADAKLAARLCKADLVTGTVGEFPEVQGIIGGYLAREDKMDRGVWRGIWSHYRPQGPNDDLPSESTGDAVSLADKIDTLIGFFAIDEKPTGSRDPFALRRAALGILRIVLARNLRLDIHRLLAAGCHSLKDQGSAAHDPALQNSKDITFNAVDIEEGERHGYWTRIELKNSWWNELVNAIASFLFERLRVILRDQKFRHDVVDAVLSASLSADLVVAGRRVEALTAFVDYFDGKGLLAGYKRAANILRIEEKKDKTTYAAAVDPAKLEAPEEQALSHAIDTATPEIERALAAEDFAAAMRALSALRAPVDAFFEKVTVNAPDAALRTNRLNLLARIKQAAHLVADFSKIEG